MTTAYQLDLAKVTPEDLVQLWIDENGNAGPLGVIGGPPCQAFSVSNVHQRDDDPRHALLNTYADTIVAFKAAFGLSFFVFENVPGLLGKRHRARYEAFKRRCEEAGFIVFEGLVDASRFQVPQYRRRVIVIGINSEKHSGIEYTIPAGNAKLVPIDVALKELPEPAFFHRGITLEEIPHHPNHVTMLPRSEKFKKRTLQPGDRRGRSFRVLQWGVPSYTVAYGNREVHVHPGCHRRLSVFEAMLLQGFPESYELKGTLSQQITLVSNAVPPPVGTAIAESIAAGLGLCQSSGVAEGEAGQGIFPAGVPG